MHRSLALHVLFANRHETKCNGGRRMFPQDCSLAGVSLTPRPLLWVQISRPPRVLLVVPCSGAYLDVAVDKKDRLGENPLRLPELLRDLDLRCSSVSGRVKESKV